MTSLLSFDNAIGVTPIVNIIYETIITQMRTPDTSTLIAMTKPTAVYINTPLCILTLTNPLSLALSLRLTLSTQALILTPTPNQYGNPDPNPNPNCVLTQGGLRSLAKSSELPLWGA